MSAGINKAEGIVETPGFDEVFVAHGVVLQGKEVAEDVWEKVDRRDWSVKN